MQIAKFSNLIQNLLFIQQGHRDFPLCWGNTFYFLDKVYSLVDLWKYCKIVNWRELIFAANCALPVNTKGQLEKDEAQPLVLWRWQIGALIFQSETLNAFYTSWNPESKTLQSRCTGSSEETPFKRDFKVHVNDQRIAVHPLEPL